MEWQKIELDIPKEILNIYHEIQNIAANSCIAGGCLSDMYMKKDFKDVDIFIKANEKKQKQIEQWLETYGAKKMRESRIDQSYIYKTALDVRTYQCDTYEIQLIFTPFGITAPKYFDYRFREFFYFKDTCYASNEAIIDISNQKLVFGVTKAPLVALTRAMKFIDRYAFSIDETSFKRFKQLFNAYEIPVYVWEEFIKKEGWTQEMMQRHSDWFPEKSTSIMQYTDQKTEDYWIRPWMKRHIKRDQIEELEQIQMVRKAYVMHMDENPFHFELEKRKEQVIKAFKKQRIHMVIQNPKLSETWTTYAGNVERYASIWYEEVVLCLRNNMHYVAEIWDRLGAYHNIYQKTLNDYSRCNLILTNDKIWKGYYQYQVDKVLKNDYIRVQVIGEGEFIWCQSQKRITYCTIEDVLCDAIVKKLGNEEVFKRKL